MAGMRRSVLFATWGDPSGWREVRYSFNGYEEKSRTTLSILRKAVEPDHVVVISLDSLSIHDEGLPKTRGAGYPEVISSAEGFVKSRLKEFGVGGDVEVFVLPARGRFKVKDGRREGVFEGLMTDYKYLLAYRVARYFIEKLSGLGGSDEVEVHLDLSHGINYMPTFAHEVVLTLSRVLRYKFSEGRVSYTVYNSDPVVGGAEGPYRVNKVMHVRNLASELPGEGLGRRPLKFLDERLGRELGRVFDELVDPDGLNMFIGGVVNGFPLLVLGTHEHARAAADVLERAVNEYVRHTVVNADDRVVRVEHKVALTKDFEVLSRVMLASEAIKGRASKPVNESYSLDSLKNVKKMYPRNDRNNLLISNELHVLEEVVKKHLEKRGPAGPLVEEKKYKEFIEGGAEEPKDEAVFTRNFHAHAGLEKNVTILRVEARGGGHEIRLRYAWDEKMAIGDVKTLILRASTNNLVKTS